MSIHRDLPHSIESERIILGAAMLTGGTAIAECQHLGLKAEDFYRENHRRLYAHYLWRLKHHKVFDMIAVVEDLAAKPPAVIEQLGGIAYVAQLADDIPSTDNVPHYVGILIDRAARRRAIQLGQRIGRARPVHRHAPR